MNTHEDYQGRPRDEGDDRTSVPVPEGYPNYLTLSWEKPLM
jgi:hypothetical protein